MNGDDAPLRFRGSPIALSAVVTGISGPVEMRMPEQRDERLAAAASAGAMFAAFAPMTADSGIMRVHLPRTTPPGTYELEVEISGEPRRVVLEIEPDDHLRIFPERLLLRGHGGETVEARVTIVNLGNVPLEIPSVAAFGVFDYKRLDDGVGRTFREGPPKGERGVDALFERAREAHGGLVRMQIEGSGSLGSGESRELGLALHLPDDLRAGGHYTGLWTLYRSSYHIEITATGKAGAAS